MSLIRKPSLRRLTNVLGVVVLLTLLGPAPTEAAETSRQLISRLQRALKKGSVEEKSEAVNDIGRLSGHLNRSESMEAAKTLRKALDIQEASEVRRLMIRALARFKLTHAWLPVVWASQEDRDPAVKDQARQELLSGGADYLEVMAKLLKEETSQAFRAELLLILRDRGRPDAIPMLMDALKEKSAIVRSAAAEALEAISGQALGYDQRKWRLWHTRWLKQRPTESGPSVSTGGRVEEPPPYVTRSLHPLFYGLKLTGKDIVFVVDISGSVGAGGITKAKRKLVEAVALLGSDVHIAALFFSDKIEMWKKGTMVLATPANKEDLLKYMRGLRPGRKTDVYGPLNAGLKILDRRITAKQAAKEAFRTAVTMITVSDGQDNMRAVPPRIIAEKLDRLDPVNSVLHSIVLGSKDSPLMAAIARLGGGHYVRAER